MSDPRAMMRVGAGIGVQGELMPTTKTIARPAPARIGLDTPIWDAEFAARWDALQASSKPSVAAAPVKRKPRRPAPQK